MSEELTPEQKELVENVKEEFHKLVPNVEMNELMQDSHVGEILHAIRDFTRKPSSESGEFLLKLAREYVERKKSK